MPYLPCWLAPGADCELYNSPDFPEMRSSFFAVGAGIAHHRDLGVVDMRQIAPTVARILRASLPTAKAVPLHVQP